MEWWAKVQSLNIRPKLCKWFQVSLIISSDPQVRPLTTIKKQKLLMAVVTDFGITGMTYDGFLEYSNELVDCCVKATRTCASRDTLGLGNYKKNITILIQQLMKYSTMYIATVHVIQLICSSHLFFTSSFIISAIFLLLFLFLAKFFGLGLSMCPRSLPYITSLYWNKVGWSCISYSIAQKDCASNLADYKIYNIHKKQNKGKFTLQTTFIILIIL